MTGFGATYSNKPQIRVLPSWLRRLAAPVLLIDAAAGRPGLRGGLGAARRLAASRSSRAWLSAPAWPGRRFRSGHRR